MDSKGLSLLFIILVQTAKVGKRKNGSLKDSVVLVSTVIEYISHSVTDVCNRESGKIGPSSIWVAIAIFEGIES